MSRLTEIQKAIEELAPEEKEELREAVVFYDRAAERFVNAVETAVAAIILKPDRFREFEPGVRTCRVSKFPYSILYTFRDHDIMILAVKHDRRDPDYWRYRVNN